MIEEYGHVYTQFSPVCRVLVWLALWVDQRQLHAVESGQ